MAKETNTFTSLHVMKLCVHTIQLIPFCVLMGFFYFLLRGFFDKKILGDFFFFQKKNWVITDMKIFIHQVQVTDTI